MVAYGRYFEDLAHKMGVFLKNKLLPVKGKIIHEKVEKMLFAHVQPTPPSV